MFFMWLYRLYPFQRVICSMEGALPFLVGLSNHRNLDIVENSSGILRNLSSYIVQCDEAERFRYVEGAISFYKLSSIPFQQKIIYFSSNMGTFTFLDPLSSTMQHKSLSPTLPWCAIRAGP